MLWMQTLNMNVAILSKSRGIEGTSGYLSEANALECVKCLPVAKVKNKQSDDSRESTRHI